MKSRIYLFPIFIFIIISISSCDEHHEAVKARRFCFGLFTSELSNSEVDQLGHISYSKQNLSAVGLQNVGIYQKDSVIFLICDGEEKLTYEGLISNLKNTTPVDSGFQILKKLLISDKTFLLDRNYKLDQKTNYTAAQGQLISISENTKRQVQTLEIINDPELLKEYKRIHAMGQVWPQINKNMKSVGVKDMEIYIWNFRAFLIMDTKPDFDMQIDGEKWSKLPREKEWQKYVSKFQKVDPDSKAMEKWQGMKLINH